MQNIKMLIKINGLFESNTQWSQGGKAKLQGILPTRRYRYYFGMPRNKYGKQYENAPPAVYGSLRLRLSLYGGQSTGPVSATCLRQSDSPLPVAHPSGAAASLLRPIPLSCGIVASLVTLRFTRPEHFINDKASKLKCSISAEE